jgi:hypothetical protein
MSICGGQSLFGAQSQYIKVSNGEFLAINGSTTADRLSVSDLRMPYKQLLRSRIILKAGQVNYLLNHLGLGDNATFLAIKVTYNSKSVIPDDNYINYSYYDDLTKVYSFAQMMVLTGNTTNRVKQLYLTNPNTKYDVNLDVMIGVIDDQYSFFNDGINQSGTSFTGLEYTDIKSYVVGQSIVINDKSSPIRPLIYLTLSNIQSIERNGSIIIIDDSSFGVIFLQFLTEYDSVQAQSLLSYILSNPNVDIELLNPVADSQPPVIYFYDKVGDVISGATISVAGNNSVPVDTNMGITFSTTVSIGVHGTAGVVTKQNLIDVLVDYTDDDRDGIMTLSSDNIMLSNALGTVSTITATGSYTVTFDYSDIALNYVNVIINLSVV